MDHYPSVPPSPGSDAASGPGTPAEQDPASEPEHTSPLPTFGSGAAGPPPYAGPPTPTPPQRPRRGAFAASVITASLLVGGGAGVGGAALWTATHDDSSPVASAPRTTTPVIDQGDPAAAQGSVEQVAAAVLPSVVKIDVSGAQGAGSGSGIILSSDGQILTNNHVVEVAGGNSGTLRVSFNDGSSAEATILGADPLTDTAVIQAKDVSGLTAATIGKSATLDVGQQVIAIGSPFGLESTVTSGIVSALKRPVSVASDGQGNSTTYPAIQTDAAINPGNSGGPLVDSTGSVVGINSSIRTAADSSLGGASGSIGLGFAIPIDEVMPIVDQMINGETPTHARIGIGVGPLTGNGSLVNGAQVNQVNAGSPAETAGIKTGDVITHVEDTLIADSNSLVATVRSYRPGDEVKVTWVRGGETQSATVTLESDASGG